MSELIKYDQLLIDLGDKLRQIRIDKGMTMRSVADKIGMDENNYGRFEKGQTNPTLKSLVKIANALDIEMNELFSNSI